MQRKRAGRRWFPLSVTLAGMILLFCGCAGTGISLTHEEMYEDYDFLVANLRDRMPHAIPIREAYRLDVWEKLAEYRSRISGVKDAREFAVLVGVALESCKGHHLELTRVSDDWPPELLKELFGEGPEGEEALRVNRKLTEYALPEVFRKTPYPESFRFAYFEGEYYLPRAFRVNGREYPPELKLLAVDGRRPEEIEKEILDYAFEFDKKRNRFYRNNFYCFTPPRIPGERSFSFQSPQGEKFDITVRDGAEIIVPGAPGMRRRIPNRPQVLYLEKYQLLYCRIPSMDMRDCEFYLKEMERIRKEHPVRFAALDIRHNGGGSDLVPFQIILALQPRTVIRNKFAYMATERQRCELLRLGRDLNDFHLEKIDFLDGNSYLISEHSFVDDTVPAEAENQIEHVYVLCEDVYSAAGTLSSRIARDNDNITSVGFHNPRLLGQGVNPSIFTLPRSKLAIRVEPALDITGCRTAAECLHDEVEVELKLAPEEYLNYCRKFTGPTLTPDYLLHDDPFMQRIFSLLPAENQRMERGARSGRINGT